ncbi:MAG TPA: sigma-54 dependent transcriptional regulator, partial [Dissulfurispiraceae bacterium]|nr:sigma-54 dependent transcriptional regulator [Dissulfurispiraceae bacterium]
MPSPKIIVVDDDRNLLELLKMRLDAAGFEVSVFSREEDALEAVKKQGFDLGIVDLQLARQDGITLMEEFRAINPEMQVIIFTAYGSIESAVEAMRKGAFGYATKPFNAPELLLQIERALESRKLNSEIKRLKDLLGEGLDCSNIVVKSEKMKKILHNVSSIAKTDCTVHIYGESGTGKELIARSIHIASSRKDNPFVAINCAAIPETLLESELFGHEKGAFTGAYRGAKGLFSQADGGTILLDEIGDMPALTQAKLLRVLEDKQFYPLGSDKPVDV